MKCENKGNIQLSKKIKLFSFDIGQFQELILNLIKIAFQIWFTVNEYSQQFESR